MEGFGTPARVCQDPETEYSGSLPSPHTTRNNLKLFFFFKKRDLPKEWSQTSNKSVTRGSHLGWWAAGPSSAWTWITAVTGCPEGWHAAGSSGHLGARGAGAANGARGVTSLGSSAERVSLALRLVRANVGRGRDLRDPLTLWAAWWPRWVVWGNFVPWGSSPSFQAKHWRDLWKQILVGVGGEGMGLN